MINTPPLHLNELWTLKTPLDFNLISALLEWLNNKPGEPELAATAYAELAEFTVSTATVPRGLELDAAWLQRMHMIMSDAKVLTA